MACRSKWLAGLAGLWVRPVDKLVGEAVGMRVDVELADGTTAVGIYYHRLLSQSVGCAASMVAFLCLGMRLPGLRNSSAIFAMGGTKLGEPSPVSAGLVFLAWWHVRAPARLRAGCAGRRLCARC